MRRTLILVIPAVAIACSTAAPEPRPATVARAKWAPRPIARPVLRTSPVPVIEHTAQQRAAEPVRVAAVPERAAAEPVRVAAGPAPAPARAESAHVVVEPVAEPVEVPAAPAAVVARPEPAVAAVLVRDVPAPVEVEVAPPVEIAPTRSNQLARPIEPPAAAAPQAKDEETRAPASAPAAPTMSMTSSPAPAMSGPAISTPAPAQQSDPRVTARGYRRAQWEKEPEEERAWTFELEPSTWFLDLDGDIGAGGDSIPVGSGVSDSFDLAGDTREHGVRGRAEARHERWSVFLEVSTFSAEQDSDRRFGGTPEVTDAAFRWTMVEAGGTYRAMEIPGFNKLRGSLDFLGGLRWNYIASEVEVTSGARTVTYRETPDWFDPFVGVRVEVPLADDVSFGARVDAGGGLGSGSRHAWNAEARFNWELAKNATLWVGYRWHDSERDFHDRDTDLQLAGPGFGVVIRF